MSERTVRNPARLVEMTPTQIMVTLNAVTVAIEDGNEKDEAFRAALINARKALIEASERYR